MNKQEIISNKSENVNSDIPRICLNMIIKNEEHVILRCLDNIRHLVDAIAIVDTGSTDKTIKIVKDYMLKYNLPGGIISEEWLDDFGLNRTSALRYAENVMAVRNTISETPWYVFFMDADNEAFGSDGESSFYIDKKKLTKDAYKVEKIGRAHV